jgi:hypothetical protein
MKGWGRRRTIMDILVKRKIYHGVLNYSLFVTTVPLKQPGLEAHFL